MLYIVEVTRQSSLDVLGGFNLGDLDAEHPFLKNVIRSQTRKFSHKREETVATEEETKGLLPTVDLLNEMDSPKPPSFYSTLATTM